MRRSPVLLAGLGLLLACRPTPPPKPPEPPPAPQPLQPWSWYAVGGILVVEGEVDRPTDLFLQGRTWRESRACEMGPVRWEMYRPRDDEPAELRDGSGRLLARWDFRKPWQPEPTPKPAPKPEPVKPPVPAAAPAPKPLPPPAAKPLPSLKSEPAKATPPVAPRPIPSPPSKGLWERIRGWFGGSQPAPKPPAPPAAAPKPLPPPAPKPLPPPEPKPLPVPKPEPLKPPVPAPKPLPSPVPKPLPPPSKGFWERVRGWFGGSTTQSLPPSAPKSEPAKPPVPVSKPVPPPAPKPLPPPPPKTEAVKPSVPAPKPPPGPKPTPPPPSKGFWERIRGWFGGTSPKPAPPVQSLPAPKPEPAKPAPEPRPEPVKPPVVVPAPLPTPRVVPPPAPKPEPVKPPAPKPVPVPAPKPEPPRPAPSSRDLPSWLGAGDGFNLLRGASGQKRICLTFDGGSAAEVAHEVLDAMRKHRIRTTIFLTGAFIQNFPDLVKRIVAEGHEVGNHTMNHPHLAPNFRRDPAWTRERFHEELLAADRAFRALVGRPMDPLWRAPYGEHTLEIRKWAEELGYRHVGWSEGADTLDWATVKERKLYRTGEKILERLDQRTARPDGDGLIVLMHLGSGRPEEDRPSRNLGRFIEAKRKAGWSFVPATQYLKDSGKVVWDSAARAALLARGAPGPG